MPFVCVPIPTNFSCITTSNPANHNQVCARPGPFHRGPGFFMQARDHLHPLITSDLTDSAKVGGLLGLF
jgi:hypothetical protein